MVRHLFGTDGVRGRAGHFLTAELALSLARTAVARMPGAAPQVLIVRDTRESGEMLEVGHYSVSIGFGCWAACG